MASAADPAGPLLTWYDDSTGERVELSGVTLDNWVAKTANLLVDGCALDPGAVATVLLPPHWQTAAVLLGCWSAGLVVGPDGEVVLATEPVASAAADRLVLGLAPMGMPLRTVPTGWVDYIAEVRGHGDHFTPVTPVRPTDPATPELTHGALVAQARTRAAELGIPDGGRVLIDADSYRDPLDWLLAPLSVGASTVLCGNLDPAATSRRAATEKVDTVLAAVNPA